MIYGNFPERLSSNGPMTSGTGCSSGPRLEPQVWREREVSFARTAGSTKNEFQRCCPGTRSDRGPSETLSSRGIEERSAWRRTVESVAVGSDRTREAAHRTGGDPADCD
jgi:hypothetical protein